MCRALRAESDVPIMMLTARDAERDRVLGLELGADDYVTKPFSSAELLSRVRAILRRRELDRANGGAAVRRLGGLHLDLVRHEVTVDGEPVRLTLSEFKVLSLLAEQPERVVSRREIMQHLWASDHVGDEHACEVHVSNLRRKIERDPARPQRLVTVRGLGLQAPLDLGLGFGRRVVGAIAACMGLLRRWRAHRRDERSSGSLRSRRCNVQRASARRSRRK